MARVRCRVEASSRSAGRRRCTGAPSLFASVSDEQQESPKIWNLCVPSMFSLPWRPRGRHLKAIEICRQSPET